MKSMQGVQFTIQKNRNMFEEFRNLQNLKQTE